MTDLSIAVPSHVSVSARRSALLDCIKSQIDVDLFFTERTLSEIRESLLNELLQIVLGILQRLDEVEFKLGLSVILGVTRVGIGDTSKVLAKFSLEPTDGVKYIKLLLDFPPV